MQDEEKKIEYKGYGGVIFKNEDDIAYYKQSQNIELAQGLLLGGYDAKGAYVIPDDLCKELTKLDKIIDEDVKGVYYVSAKVSTYKLKFIVEISKIDDNKKSATLKLVEEMKVAGVLDKKFMTTVSTFIDDDDINFVFRMKKAFSIYAKIEAEGRDMSNSEKSAKIMARISQLLDLRKQIYYNKDQLDKLYIKEIIAILKASGDGGQRVLKRYLEIVKSPKFKKLKVNRYVVLRQILDMELITAIAEGYFSEKSLKKLRDTRKIFVLKAEQEMKNFLQTAASKPKSKSKGGGGKKGGKTKGKDKGGKKSGPKAPDKRPLNPPYAKVSTTDQVQNRAGKSKYSEIGWRTGNYIEKVSILDNEKDDNAKAKDEGMTL